MLGRQASAVLRAARRHTRIQRARQKTTRLARRTTSRDGERLRRTRLHGRARRRARPTGAGHQTMIPGDTVRGLRGTRQRDPNPQRMPGPTNRDRRPADLGAAARRRIRPAGLDLRRKQPKDAGRRRMDRGDKVLGTTQAGLTAQRMPMKRMLPKTASLETRRTGLRESLVPTAPSWNATRTGARLR